MKPAEGTILTVSRVAAQHAVELCQAEPTLTAEQVLAAIIEQGHTALEETVHQNPVLEKAGVVDAGGFGFITIFEGMLDALRGIHKERAVAAEPTKSTADFAAINDEDITFTYCTEFIASRKDKARNVARLRSILNEIGDSLVVVEDDDIVKVHVHTDQPNKALEEGLKFGPLLTVKIENMREQHTAKVIEGHGGRAQGARDRPRREKVWLCSRCCRRGASRACSPTSARTLWYRAVRPHEPVHGRHSARCRCRSGGNRFRAAEQQEYHHGCRAGGSSLRGEKVIVVPTKTIPQGISSMLAVDPEAEQDSELALTMLDAAKHVRSGQVTYAARDSEFDGKKIKQGEYLSLCEGKLCANGKETSVLKSWRAGWYPTTARLQPLSSAKALPRSRPLRLRTCCTRKIKEMEINVIDGGQPVYYYIISVE